MEKQLVNCLAIQFAEFTHIIMCKDRQSLPSMRYVPVYGHQWLEV